MNSKRKIPVAEPAIGEEELKYVTQAVASGWVSSAGSFNTWSMVEQMVAPIWTIGPSRPTEPSTTDADGGRRSFYNGHPGANAAGPVSRLLTLPQGHRAPWLLWQIDTLGRPPIGRRRQVLRSHSITPWNPVGLRLQRRRFRSWCKADSGTQRRLIRLRHPQK